MSELYSMLKAKKTGASSGGGGGTTVNNATITIQKNGTTVDSFTSNQATDKTINITVPTSAADVSAIPTTAKGANSGVAELDANGKIPSSQLPSYVDDVIEGYYYDSKFYEDSEHTTEITGTTGKIYVDLLTNKTYRWSGSGYTEISESLALGETSSTAYRGDRGKTAYDHATDSSRHTTAETSGLYKFATTAEGHIASVSEVQKSDITELGIPGQDTTVGSGIVLTGYTSESPAQSDTIVATDNVNEAIKKLDERSRVDENNILSLQQKTAKVYGFHVNPNESDSSAAVTYLADAVGMTPAKMGSTAFDWGSWADAFFIPKPCMVKPDGTVDYYLNPNNYAQKLDGTASELATAPTDNLLSNVSYVNNAMMEWGKIYFKYEAGQADGEWSFYVSNMNVDGTFKCWCNINANNNEIDHFYTAIYNGVGCKSKMRSVSGVKLSTTNEADTTTAAEETAAAAANNATTNPEWYTEVWSDRLLINALLYLMGKSLDLQGTYGNGISSGGQTEKQNYITGSLDDKGLFYGDTSGTTTAVKVFGMENLWACCWRRVAGCILDNNVLKVKMTYDTADGSSAHGYNLTGAGYLNFGSPASAEGWLSKITADSEKGYKPSGTQSNSSLYYKDYFYKNASIVAYLLLGGSSGFGASCGFFCYLRDVVSLASWSVSAALSLKRWG